MSGKMIVKIGMIGAGKAAQWHLRAYKKIPEAKVVAICDLDSNKGLKLARKYNIKNYFASYKELLSYKELEAIDICVPTKLHKEMVIESLKKGLNVYIEKPMCCSLNEAEEIIAINKTAKKIIFNGYNYRFWPEILRIKSIIASGELGDIRFILFIRTSKNPSLYMLEPELNSGIINELSCHFIDLLYWWGFGNPISVCAHGTNLIDNEIMPDTVSINIDYDKGLEALIINSLSIPGIYPEIQVAGTRGSLKLKYGKLILEKKDNYTLFESLVAAFKESVVIPFRILHNPFKGSCRYFIDSILGKHINECNELMAKKILEVTLLANRSYIEKKPLLY